MLKSDVHRFYMTRADKKTVEEYDINVIDSEILLLDVEYMFDGALEIVKNFSSITSYLWDGADYSLINLIFRQINNTSKLESVTKIQAVVADADWSQDFGFLFPSGLCDTVVAHLLFVLGCVV